MIDHKEWLKSKGRSKVYDALTAAKVSLQNSAVLADTELEDEEAKEIRKLVQEATALMAKAQHVANPAVKGIIELSEEA